MSIDYSLANVHQLMRQLVTNGSMDLVDPRGGQPLWDDLALIDADLLAVDRCMLARPSIRSGQPATMVPAFYRGTPRADLVGSQTGSYANRRKTVEYALPTRITQLATNTTVATATRHDTASITINIPESSSRVFKSVRLVATYHTEYAATNSVLGILLGVKLGSAATQDKIRDNYGALNTANKNLFDAWDDDFTTYFNNNFGSGTSQTCVASIAVRTTNADNINNVTFKLIITYEYNAREAVATRLKTIRIPIQSQSDVLTATHQEIGTDGNAPAPANQIPALDTFLPEASKTYRAIYLELFAQTNSVATTNFTPFVKIDSAAEVALATVQESVFATEKTWQTIYDLTGLDTSVAHALSMRCDLASRLSCVGAILVVTYEYNPSTTTSVMCEGIVPLGGSYSDPIVPGDGQGFGSSLVGYTDSPAYTDLFVAMIDVQEANPVLKQSGIFLVTHLLFTQFSMAYAAVSPSPTVRQVFRDYAMNSSNTGSIPSGDNLFIHRCDTGTGWSLSRGLNRLLVKKWDSTPGRRSFTRGFAIINYTATAPLDTETVNQAVNFLGTPYPAGVGGTNPDGNVQKIVSGIMRVPVLGSPWKISGMMLETWLRFVSNTGSITSLGVNVGELDSSGTINGQPHPAGLAEPVASLRSYLGFTRAFNSDSLHTGKLVPDAERLIARQFLTFNNFETPSAWSWWITYHQMQFTVSGIVTVDGSPVAANKVVNIYAVGPTPTQEDTTEFVTSTTTAMDGTGSFSVTVPDSTRTYFATYANDGNIGRSLDGVPSVSTFNITIGAAGRRFIGSPFIRRLQ